MELSPQTRARIEAGIRNWNDYGSDARVRFENAKRPWLPDLLAFEQAIRASEQLTEDDFQIIVACS